MRRGLDDHSVFLTVKIPPINRPAETAPARIKSDLDPDIRQHSPQHFLFLTRVFHSLYHLAQRP